MVCILSLEWVAIAEDKPKAPTFTVEQERTFFKAQAALNQAQVQLEHSNEYAIQQAKAKAFQKVVVDLQSVCGAEFQLALSTEGDPICQVKPKEPAKTNTPPAPMALPKK